MTITPIAFRSGRHTDLSEGELVASIIVINQGDVLTPCKPVNVWRYTSGRCKVKKLRPSWGRFPDKWVGQVQTIALKPTEGSPATEEDDEWVNHSRATLRGWMAENEE